MAHIGIGSLLQQARVQQGKSIEEVSRDTHIRPEYLQALEGERFDGLIADVYARAFLRSYSVYLGLDANAMVTEYSRVAPNGQGTALVERPVGRRRRRDRSMAPGERHPSWWLVIALAAGTLAVLAAVGLLARASSPRTGTPSGSIRALPPTVVMSLQAIQDVRVTVAADGRAPTSFLLREDESRTFEASRRIAVSIDHGGMTRVVVNGFSLETPGQPADRYTATFTPRDYRSTPSPPAP